MVGIRPVGLGGGVPAKHVDPGDLLLLGEAVNQSLVTIGAGTWTATQIVSGLIYRTGPTAGYTDTTDTAAAILAALAGNQPAAEVMPGTSFRLLLVNSVAFALTFAAGVGVATGVGVLNVAASTWREYLLTVLNATPSQIITCGTTNASAVVTFVLPPGMLSLPLGSVPNPQGVNITPGATVSGTGITAGTTVIGLTYGQGGITGVTLSANATATNNLVALTFGPTVKIDGLRSGTL